MWQDKQDGELCRSGPQQMDWPVWHPSRASAVTPVQDLLGVPQLVSGPSWGHKTAQVTGAPSEHPALGPQPWGSGAAGPSHWHLPACCHSPGSPAALRREPGARPTTVRHKSMCFTDFSLVRAHSATQTQVRTRLTGLRGEG